MSFFFDTSLSCEKKDLTESEETNRMHASLIEQEVYVLLGFQDVLFFSFLIEGKKIT